MTLESRQDDYRQLAGNGERLVEHDVVMRMPLSRKNKGRCFRLKTCNTHVIHILTNL
ncbi:hypothetical protein IFVP182_P20016 [Vibrio parahaemolyticus]